MVFRWRDEQTLRFVLAYKKCRCLWDNNCKEYKKTNRRDRAYQSLIDQLKYPNLTVADVKAKIKTVRTRYASELHKVRESEQRRCAEGEELYVPRLFWYKEIDSYLRPFMKSTPYAENLNCSNWKSDQEEESLHIVKNEIYVDDDDNDDGKSDNDISGSQSTDYISAAFTEKYPNPKAMKRKTVHSIDLTEGSCGKLQKRFDDNNTSQQVHEFDVFCNSLAIQLKKMPLERALLCQEKLQAVMTRERLSLLSSEH